MSRSVAQLKTLVKRVRDNDPTLTIEERAFGERIVIQEIADRIENQVMSRVEQYQADLLDEAVMKSGLDSPARKILAEMLGVDNV